jgi:hypothetical protein
LRRPPRRNHTAFDSQRLAVDQNIGNLPARGLDDSAEGLPRNVHPDSRLFLVQPLEVGQTDRFVLVEAQRNLPAG